MNEGALQQDLMHATYVNENTAKKIKDYLKNTNDKNKKTVNNSNSGIKNILYKVNQLGNCYVFAMAPKVGFGGYNKRLQKATPGYKCDYFKKQSINFTSKNSCKKMQKRIICDNPEYVHKVREQNYKKKIIQDLPKRQHYMVVYLASGKTKPNQDFHFIRRVYIQDVIDDWEYLRKKTKNKAKQQLFQMYDLYKKTGLNKYKYIWAHQRGWQRGGPVIEDAGGDIIVNPKTLNFDYGDLFYDIYCGMFQVATRKASVNSTYNINV